VGQSIIPVHDLDTMHRENRLSLFCSPRNKVEKGTWKVWEYSVQKMVKSVVVELIICVLRVICGRF
jgi:hypothetical protein